MNSRSLQSGVDVNRLVAALAHSIRNPLHAIGLNLHTLRVVHEQGQKLPDDELGRMLSQCTTEIDRIERLMQQMLAFAAIEPAQPELIDLAMEVSGAVAAVRPQMQSQGVLLDCEMPKQRTMVLMDRMRLRHILLNLLQGSQQLLGGDGRIRVALGQNGGQAQITVADDGPGLSQLLRTEVFDPFGSSAQGITGLGLAVVKRLVEETNGEVRCEENDGQGTRFRVLLPLAQQAADAQETEHE